MECSFNFSNGSRSVSDSLTALSDTHGFVVCSKVTA
jgi:hypothetical protein